MFKENLITNFESQLKEYYYNLTENIKLQRLRNKYIGDFNLINSNDLVTVYTPTFNRSKILTERAVPSALSQTYKNLEYLIIGDCCTDNTGEEIKKKFNDKRIKFTNLSNREKNYPNALKNNWLAGAVLPSNYAFTISKGKWIARLDDDEQWSEDHIEKLLNFAKKNDLEFVSANVENKRFGTINIEKGHEVYSDYFRTSSLRKKIQNNPKIGGISTWLTRFYIMKHFKFNESCWKKKYNSDHGIEFAVRMIKAGAKIGHLDEVVTFQYPRPGEKTVGWEAYQQDQKNKEKHYKIS